MTPIEKNARGTTECAYPGAFTSAQGPHRKIALEKNVKMGIF
jgi:hypothetical protein